MRIGFFLAFRNLKNDSFTSFLSLKFWIARAKKPRRILNARNNTRFSKFAFVKKYLVFFFKFPRL